MRIFDIYLIAVSVAAVILTISDKWCAQKRKQRVPEAILFFTAVLGGSAAMYLVMLLIRHKTLHKRFMLGLPTILLLQVVLYTKITVFG